jgi:hypothetical protein
MWLSIWSLVTVWAASPEDLVVRRGGAEVVIHEIGMPKGAIDPRFRVCRVTLDWQQEAVLTARDCHPNVMDEVTAALGRWDFEVSTPPSRPRELLELWYVFPESNTGTVRTFVRQAHGQELTLPEGGPERLPWKVEAFRPLQFPEEASALPDLKVTDCEAKVDIAATGVPGGISVTHCDEVFHAPLEQQLRTWRFETPELDGAPFVSGVTLTAHFSRGLQPGEPGKVRVDLPPEEGKGSLEEGPHYEEQADEPTLPLPDHPPLFVVDHRSYAEVQVYEMVWPELPPHDQERTCDVLWVVNSKNRVWSWTEGCDEDVRGAVEQASAQWVLAPGEIERGESTARFRGTLIFPPEGEPILRIPTEDLQPGELPPHVESYAPPRTLRTLAPTLPRELEQTPGEPVSCEFDIEVDRRGKPSQIAPITCPAGYDAAAEEVLRKWRWIPAEVAGETVSSRVRVRIRFG